MGVAGGDGVVGVDGIRWVEAPVSGQVGVAGEEQQRRRGCSGRKGRWGLRLRYARSLANSERFGGPDLRIRERVPTQAGEWARN